MKINYIKLAEEIRSRVGRLCGAALAPDTDDMEYINERLDMLKSMAAVQDDLNLCPKCHTMKHFLGTMCKRCTDASKGINRLVLEFPISDVMLKDPDIKIEGIVDIMKEQAAKQLLEMITEKAKGMRPGGEVKEESGNSK